MLKYEPIVKTGMKFYTKKVMVDKTKMNILRKNGNGRLATQKLLFCLVKLIAYLFL